MRARRVRPRRVPPPLHHRRVRTGRHSQGHVPANIIFDARKWANWEPDRYPQSANKRRRPAWTTCSPETNLRSGRSGKTGRCAAPLRLVRGGSDSGATAGRAHACASIGYALSQASAGSRVLVGRGSYRESANQAGGANVITPALSGLILASDPAIGASAANTMVDATGELHGIVDRERASGAPRTSASSVRPEPPKPVRARSCDIMRVQQRSCDLGRLSQAVALVHYDGSRWTRSI
jgi:hypothetical protein